MNRPQLWMKVKNSNMM